MADCSSKHVDDSSRRTGGTRSDRRSFLRAMGYTGMLASLSGGAHVGKAFARMSRVPSDLTSASVATLAELIRSKTVSSEEVARAFLSRIRRLHPTLNAVHQVDEDRVIREARRADALLARGVPSGVLHGVPCTIKDNLDTADIVTAVGTVGWKNRTPTKDATVVKRLRDAGAVILGKTNLPELALAYESDNLVYGRTRNPYDVDRTVGGSSGGAAAAVAAQLSPFDIGNDAGGSIRLPCAFNGVAGLKDSRRIPLTGCPGDGGWAVSVVATSGPIARTVSDLSLILPVISGPDAYDPFVHGSPLHVADDVKLSALRVAFFTDNGIAPPTQSVVDAVIDTAKSVGVAVANVEEQTPPRVEESYEIVQDVFFPELLVAAEACIEQCGTGIENISDLLAGMLRRARETVHAHGPFTSKKREEVMRRWFGFQSAILHFFRDWDVVLCPASPCPAPRHGTTWDLYPGIASYAFIGNLCPWLPSVTIRAGTSPEELPIGVQVIARPWREDLALAVAGYLEQQGMAGWKRPDLLE